MDLPAICGLCLSLPQRKETTPFGPDTLWAARRRGKRDPDRSILRREKHACNYSIKVAIPLASLGLENPVGRTIGFELSIGIANALGDRRERAAHWAGLSEAFVVDRPGSTRLLPGTWGTLTFEGAPTSLRDTK